MIGQTIHDAGRPAEALDVAIAASHAPPAQTAAGAADDVRSHLSRAAAKPVPKPKRIADAQALEAHAERRRRLAAQVRLENPSRTDEEIEARLEQFGV
jgi:hypothetical protein